eukprot:CAMPEP_0119430330 /NCGR_PEP_ID=MMETSP1335-20130426/43846_1 /TAXON_ID=259385 /ORGANISM="Chrysoculter rhomboideus, Strain RCC1486" /LENGTH=168 /DNA_ID=CAMNT_0007456089 /DNA_START=1 /DNA_END=505 /DNA_ORIENTATION=+
MDADLLLRSSVARASVALAPRCRIVHRATLVPRLYTRRAEAMQMRRLAWLIDDGILECVTGKECVDTKGLEGNPEGFDKVRVSLRQQDCAWTVRPAEWYAPPHQWRPAAHGAAACNNGMQAVHDALEMLVSSLASAVRKDSRLQEKRWDSAARDDHVWRKHINSDTPC